MTTIIYVVVTPCECESIACWGDEIENAYESFEAAEAAAALLWAGKVRTITLHS